MANQQLTINGSILFKRGSRAALEAEPMILQKGEPAYETDTFKMKIGNGEDAYKDLPYVGKFDKDEILEGYFFNGKFFYDELKNDEVIGDTNKLYIDLSTNKSYRWGGSTYVEVSPSLQITEDISSGSPDGMVPVARAVYAYGQNILNTTKADNDTLKNELIESYDNLYGYMANAIEDFRIANELLDEKIVKSRSEIEESGAAAHSVLQSAIETEVALREARDQENATKFEELYTDLEKQVDIIEQEFETKDNIYKTSFTEINETIDAMETAIGSEISGLSNDLDIEIERAKGVEEVLKTDLAAAISEAVSERNSIREAYAVADGVIAAEIEEIEEQLINISNTHNADIATINQKIDNLPVVNLDGVINDLNAHIATAESNFSSLQESVEQTNNNLAQTNASIQAGLKSAQDDRILIRDQYTNSDEILRTTHEADKTELESKIAAGDLEVATDLANEIARATAKEADILADMKAYADGIKTNLLGDGVLNETYDTLTEIAAWIAGDGVDATELVNAIAVETNERKAVDAAIEATIAANKTEILGKLDTTDKKHQEDIATTNSTIASLGNELRGVDTAINTRIDEIIQQFTDAINLVYTNYQAEDQARKAEVIEYFNTQLGVIENGSY